MAGYIPGPDVLALQWMQHMVGKIEIAPARFYLSQPDAEALRRAVDDFATALAEASDPGRKAPFYTNVKAEARLAAEQLCRQYAIFIKHNAGISNADKVDIGIRPVNTGRTPAPEPTSSPLVAVIAATPGAQTVRCTDSMNPDAKAKPPGVLNVQLFVAITPEAVEAHDVAKFYGAFTRNPIGVGFADADDGKVATYFARWANRRGDVGPWSNPVSMRIAA